jgi:hypothetical protein
MALGFFNPMLQRPLNNPNFRVIERRRDDCEKKDALYGGLMFLTYP